MSFDYLVDSDIFVALSLPDDALATSVGQLLDKIEAKQERLATTNWVIAETATVLSYRDTHTTALKFLDMIEASEIPVLRLTPDLEQTTYRLFREQTTKRTSMVDCSNVAVAQYYSIPQLLSFDGFYKRFGFTSQSVTT